MTQPHSTRMVPVGSLAHDEHCRCGECWPYKPGSAADLDARRAQLVDGATRGAVRAWLEALPASR